jgi:nucleoside-diphosphate-sugar epimerase
VKVLVTGATGYLGWRATVLLRERGHEVVALARPRHAQRAASAELPGVVELDAGAPEARDLVAGCAGVLHFAGVPDPAQARHDPARAVRENVGTTVSLLDGCAEHGALLVLPSTTRAGIEPPPDAYGMSKRLAEEACRLHRADAVALRMTSIFGPGQVRWEGATGAIASFAARAFDGEPIVIPGDPRRTRDFLYVDDLVDGLEALLRDGAEAPVLSAGSGVPTALEDAARLVVDAVGSGVRVELPGGTLPPGEGESYALDDATPRLRLAPRPLAEAVAAYVDWLRLHPAAPA